MKLNAKNLSRVFGLKHEHAREVVELAEQGRKDSALSLADDYMCGRGVERVDPAMEYVNMGDLLAVTVLHYDGHWAIMSPYEAIQARWRGFVCR